LSIFFICVCVMYYICIVRRDQGIIWNILWLNPMSRSPLSYKIDIAISHPFDVNDFWWLPCQSKGDYPLLCSIIRRWADRVSIPILLDCSGRAPSGLWSSKLLQHTRGRLIKKRQRRSFVELQRRLQALRQDFVAERRLLADFLGDSGVTTSA